MEKKVKKNAEAAINEAAEAAINEAPLSAEDKPTTEEIVKIADDHLEWKMLNASLKPLKKICLKFIRNALTCFDAEAQIAKLETVIDRTVKSVARMQSVNELTSHVAQMTAEEKEVLKQLLNE